MVPAVGVGAGEAAASRGLRAPLRHRDFRYLAGGLATSQVGEWLASLALIVFVLEETGSAGWVAAAGTARLLPYVALGPIGGTIADRLPRLKVMIASDLARVLSSGALAWVVASTGSALAAIVLSTLTACFSVAHAPCVVAAMPRIVREDELAAANAITTTITNAAIATRARPRRPLPRARVAGLGVYGERRHVPGLGAHRRPNPGRPRAGSRQAGEWGPRAGGC